MTTALVVSAYVLIAVSAAMLGWSVARPSENFDQRAKRFKNGSGTAMTALIFAVPTDTYVTAAVALALVVAHLVRHETDTKKGF